MLNSFVFPFIIALSTKAIALIVVLSLLVVLEGAYLVYLKIVLRKERKIANDDFEDEEEEEEEFDFDAQEAETKEQLIVYNYSFEARLFLADLETKKKYSQIKNHLLSYQGITSKMSWKDELFILKNKIVLKLAFRKRSLKVFLGVNAEKYEALKNNLIEDNGDNNLGSLKLVGENALEQLLSFVDKWMEENSVLLKPNYEQRNYIKEELPVGQLINLGLIKISVKEMRVE